MIILFLKFQILKNLKIKILGNNSNLNNNTSCILFYKDSSLDNQKLSFDINNYLFKNY